jgi:6-phosphofructokinase 1
MDEGAERPIRRVAVLTSGGDAPGMNACIRAMTRTGLARGWQVWGIRYGYQGLLDGDMAPLGWADVGGIIETGGTVLGSSRCRPFRSEDGQRRALGQLAAREIDALVIIGGNGTQHGALALDGLGFPVVGVASTIDNDLYGSEPSIGVDTALNVAMESIDRLRTTAFSHRRISLVEVMGRDSGYLALMAGLAGGAEAVVVPEDPVDLAALEAQLAGAHRRKRHALVVVAEGAVPGTAGLAAHFRALADRLDVEVRVTVLGHVQRGASPTAADRLLGTRLGAAATEALADGRRGVLVGLLDGRTAQTTLDEVCRGRKVVDPKLLDLAELLAR